MTVVYVDSVFVLNAIMDYLLLLTTAQMSGIPLRRRRYLLAALFGGGYAVAGFLPGCGFLSTWLIKGAAGILMALIAYGGERRFLRLVVLLFTVSCGFGGCVLALGLLTGGGVPMVSGVFFTEIDAKILLLSAFAAYLVLSVVFRASAKHGGRGGTLIEASIYVDGKHVTLTALCDTGNTLRDPMTGRPVLVADGARLAPLWSAAMRGYLTPEQLRTPTEIFRIVSQEDAQRFRLIPYQSVGNANGLLLAFRSDWADVAGKRYDRLLVGLSPDSLGMEFCALWGADETGGKRNHAKSVETSAVTAGSVGPSSTGTGSLHRRK